MKANAGGLTPTIQQQGLVIMATPTVNFLSYNSTGIAAAKCQFIQDICDNHNIAYLSIQEHFKWSKVTSKYFIEKFDKYNSYVIPAYRPKSQDSGRAKAGLAQLSLKTVDVKKDRVVIPRSEQK